MKEITSYHEKKYVEDTLKVRELLTSLPPFAREYFRAMEPTTSVRTRIAYAYDLKVFFTFLMDTNSVYKNYDMKDFRPSDLDLIQSVDLEEYMEYLKVYDSSDKQMTNTERGIYRKMSSLRSFYAYYYKRQLIQTNPTLLIDMPKIHEKNIIRLEPDEIANLLDYIEKGGEALTGQRKAYYEKTKIRDFAIVTLLLGTGIRVSELVGLDLEDIDFKNNGLHLIRKGNKEMIVYFGEEVEQALHQYIDTDRAQILPLPGHEHALFYSIQKKRIGVQAVQNLVKKYAREITPLKKITPHKLRSTYGTALYQETDDIYLVAEVLGHNDVNTTRKHYAAMSDQKRRYAANKVTLRESKNE
jgi:integrase/recombinase XerC